MTAAANQLPLSGLGAAQALVGPVTISVPEGVEGLVVEAVSTFTSGTASASGESLTIFESVDQGARNRPRPAGTWRSVTWTQA